MSQDTPVAMFPKPDKRGPKKPKPLARATRPIPRKVKVKKVRKTPVAKLKRQAADLWAVIVKLPQRCRWIGHIVGKKPHECKGPLQGQHGFGKKAYPSVRYDPRNGWCGCAGSHTYWSHRQAEWGQWIDADWRRQGGEALADEMRRLANTDVKHDRVFMEAKVAELRAELAARQQQYPAAA